MPVVAIRPPEGGGFAVNFIDDRELAARFAADMVPGRERFAYLALTVGLSYLACVTLIFYPPDHVPVVNRYDIAGEVAYFAIVMATLLLAYRVNRMGDDRDFIARYICLSFPITVRCLALFLVVLILKEIAFGLWFPEAAVAGAAADFVILTLLYVYMGWRIATAIQIAAGADYVFARN